MTIDTEEKIKELGEENRKLKELNAMRTDLISLNAHQIRTDLSAIKWIVKMILDSDYGNLTSEQEAILKKVYDSNEHAISLVSQMLLANKAESMDDDYKMESVDLQKLLNENIEQFRAEALKKQIEIVFEKEEKKLPLVRADKDKIKIVIQNLLENAIRYNKERGRVYVNLREQDKFLEVGVRDTGIGVDPEDREKIFSKFFRAENAKKATYFGTGLGLFTCRKIVDRHGGKIWVESKLNEGSTFFFTVPVAK